MASTQQVPPINEQQQFWDWHWQNLEERKVLNDWTERRAREVIQLVQTLNLQHPHILDMGCGQGWFTERLSNLADVTGIDLSPEAIAAARARRPDIKYIAANVYEAALPQDYFDIIVSQEVIAHVENQPLYVQRAADSLKVGGYLILTTGNKFVMDRMGDVGWNVQPPQHIAHQLSKTQLKEMLAPRFNILKISTIIPHGQRGILRVVNSYKLNAIVSRIIPQEKLERWKEKAGFGWQIVFLAQKKA